MSRFTLALVVISTLILAIACKGKTDSQTERVINLMKAEDTTITLSSISGELKRGHNELTLSFTDPSGRPIKPGAASLIFHMPAMGNMAEMNDRATLTTTASSAGYKAVVELEVPGTWEAQVKYQISRNIVEASMTVQAK